MCIRDRADYVVYLDDTLLGDGWERELKPGGLVLANSTRTLDVYKRQLSSYPCMKARFLTLNAIRFARGFRRQWGRRIAVLRLFGVYRRGRGKGGL